MGMRYIVFRIVYELKKRTGILKNAYPTSYQEKQFVSLDVWRKNAPAFFFHSKEELGLFVLSEQGKHKLKKEYQLIKEGKLRFFSSKIYDLGVDYDWVTNPDTNYKYNKDTHWTSIPDFDPEKGDIKYVWEKSRFSYLYTIIRYDKYFKEDQSSYVFQQITDWIDKNPLNCGPNYVCSQETSLRVLNWIFALYYYRFSENLTEEKFQKIINSIYWQLMHVESNIHFSRIAVRNNHAITETMMLLLSGVLFPFFSTSHRWFSKGKKYFEEEVLYQVYKDGSYIQYSMNYQRVAIQLFTWVNILVEKNNVELKKEVRDRMKKCLDFLYQLQEDKIGELPNYGANDGALFFPLNACTYRDYRPQLNALFYYYNKKGLYDFGDYYEDLFWYYGVSQVDKDKIERKSSEFKETGYYTLREKNKYAFIRCGNHKDRPSQADNLHIDLWVNGVNLLRDAGSYKYNSSPEDIKYFMGTSSHNTVQLDEFDQMEKGGRFIWYNWSVGVKGQIVENEDYILFDGEILAYKHVIPNIRHRRIIKQYKNVEKWEVVDQINNQEYTSFQIWNLHPLFFELGYKIESYDKDGNPIKSRLSKGFYSSFYGEKEVSDQLKFSSTEGYFQTIISK